MTLTVDDVLKFPPHRLQRKEPRFTYLGAGAKNRNMEAWVKVVQGCTKYVDPTAGSCNQPYMIGSTYGIPVSVNDASYYSYCIGSGLFCRTERINHQLLAEVLVEALDKPVAGIFTRLLKASRRPIPDEVVGYIDGMLVLIDRYYEGSMKHFMKAVVGRSLLTTLAIRGLTFAGSEKDRILVPEDFTPYVYRAAITKDHFMTPGSASCGHCKDFLEQEDLKGASVNFDPAWPFKGKKPNPYHFYTDLGSVLKREMFPTFQFWKDNDPKAILEEFIGWVELCFMRGAREVYIWNQTTNAPSRDYTITELVKHFRCEEVLNTWRKSTFGKYEFQDYVLRLET